MSEISQDINALVQADIDGTITPEERARLQELLASREDVREFHTDCGRLALALGDLETLDPPPGLDDSILAAVREPRKEGEEGEAPWETGSGEEAQGGWRGLFELWFRYPVLRYATAFLVGAILTSVLSGRGDGGSDLRSASLAGTMSPPPEFNLLETRRLEAGGIQMRLDFLRAKELLQLRIDMDSASPVTVQVRYLPRGYRFFGFSQRVGSLTELDAGDGELALQVTGHNGFNLFLVQNDAQADAIELLFSRDGELVETLSISPAAPGVR